MGMFGELAIEIDGVQPGCKENIIEALAKWATPEKWTTSDDWMEYDEEKNFYWSVWCDLWDGVGRDEIAHAVWKANGGPCEITVKLWATEHAPYDESEYDENDYHKMMGHAEDEPGEEDA